MVALEKYVEPIWNEWQFKPEGKKFFDDTVTEEEYESFIKCVLRSAKVNSKEQDAQYALLALAKTSPEVFTPY